MELGVGSKLKGYLLRFKAALGDVPYVRKLTSLLDFNSSSEPSTEYFGEAIVEDRTNYDSRKQCLTTHKVPPTSCRFNMTGTTTWPVLTATSSKTPMTLKHGWS